MKKNKKYILTSLIVCIFYCAILSATGLFGPSAQHIVFLIAPWFFALIGLALAIIIPYRVMWAIDRNNEIRRKIDEERRMAAAQARNKKLKEEAMRYDSMV